MGRPLLLLGALLVSMALAGQLQDERVVDDPVDGRGPARPTLLCLLNSSISFLTWASVVATSSSSQPFSTDPVPILVGRSSCRWWGDLIVAAQVLSVESSTSLAGR